ncbi:MAG: class I SAM-dependent methyltransferase [Gammaproteobacteria bacterium]|nr:class I SAM-dependent methyltransferase [Gammaproteobacteria bacterium]
MSSVARKIERPAGSSRLGPVVSRQPSKLLPSMFKMIDVNHRLTVLEIGSALHETVDFFSQFKCRLHFVDLFNEPFMREQQASLSEKDLKHAFEEQLRFPPGTQIDICLLWDFLCYLDDRALRAFNSALRPWLHFGTKTHGFGVHHLAIRLENIQYGVIDEETLSIRKRLSAQMPYYPHSQIEMHEMMNCFDFERGLLLPEGKLEMLLKPRD